ncbi:hypothetical protein FRC0024_01053 [Corynebacterium diphtheriae]|nr:hypothetical protein FRC0032_00165 [Corynebacterium diphtheriae]CAB0692707.1 hypothetical protein FRC0024_01053 [Corynebacterium diphtheriae]CAB0718922.1 hypothetical protein FRC0101_00123 [Corynebacterium diphtheriae]CAB0730345.1 hypothetical protein FRC0114_00116 [Corynebacterium diphtheriae]CAB0731378.1 hypothetical protein FRC0150_00165 [Corynebacterium diphtheriae]
MCGLGFLCICRGLVPLFRLLELKNTKTAGRDFFAEMPTLGFRSLELKFSDSCSWIRAGARPTRTPTSRVGKRRLMSPILPVYGGIRGRIFASKVPSDRLFGDGGRIYKGVVVGNDRTFRG